MFAQRAATATAAATAATAATAAAPGRAFPLTLARFTRERHQTAHPATPLVRPLFNGTIARIARKIPMDNPSKMLHKFKNKELERKVFTHTSAAISANRWAPDLKAPHMDNQRLEFIGDAILKGLTAHMIDTMCPNMNHGHMSELMAALINNPFYALLARRLELPSRLVTGVTASEMTAQSDRVLGGLFEAYVGGIHKDLGMHNHRDLYAWFQPLMEPYATAFRMELEKSTAPEVVYEKRVQPEPVSETRLYSTWLHEYATLNLLKLPEYKFQKEILDGNVVWVCNVKIDDKEFAGVPGSKKLDTKESVCEKVYHYICANSGWPVVILDRNEDFDYQHATLPHI